METVNAKSILSTTFHLGTFQMPVRLYKTTDAIGLSGNLFHDGCSGKIRQHKTCELHPNTEDPATFSGVQIGNKIVPLTPELKTQLLDGDVEFRSVGVYRLSALIPLMLEQSISLLEPFEMVPDKYFEVPYSTLLNRLRVRKQFVLSQYGKDNMRRYGLLLPSGIFTPIRYSEEVRDRRFTPSESDRRFSKVINAELDSLEAEDFPELSASDIYDRIQAWFTGVAMGRNIVAYKYEIKERVNA